MARNEKTFMKLIFDRKVSGFRWVDNNSMSNEVFKKQIDAVKAMNREEITWISIKELMVKYVEEKEAIEWLERHSQVRFQPFQSPLLRKVTSLDNMKKGGE